MYDGQKYYGNITVYIYAKRKPLISRWQERNRLDYEGYRISSY